MLLPGTRVTFRPITLRLVWDENLIVRQIIRKILWVVLLFVDLICWTVSYICECGVSLDTFHRSQNSSVGIYSCTFPILLWHKARSLGHNTYFRSFLKHCQWCCILWKEKKNKRYSLNKLIIELTSSTENFIFILVFPFVLVLTE